MNVLNRAVLLEVLTIAWTLVAGITGLIAGTLSRSVSLTAFGLDSGVELVCAIVLIQRLRVEAAFGPDASEVAERRASRIVGFLLLVAAAYVGIEAVWHLLWHITPDASRLGLVLTAATIPVMIPLSRGKLRIAAIIPSRALRADAIGNVVCWYLAAVVVISLIAESRFHIAWLDGAASLLIVGLLIFEGVHAVRADELATR